MNQDRTMLSEAISGIRKFLIVLRIMARRLGENDLLAMADKIEEILDTTSSEAAEVTNEA